MLSFDQARSSQGCLMSGHAQLCAGVAVHSMMRMYFCKGVESFGPGFWRCIRNAAALLGTREFLSGTGLCGLCDEHMELLSVPLSASMCCKLARSVRL